MGKNSFGIAALICAILGFFCCGILSIVAIILGAIGIGKDEDNGMAIAGLVLGLISLVVGLILVFFLWAFVSSLLGGLTV
ncbi:MAG: DUF4190 domain-containing protein [Candidatus Odinarchaeota archaeon]